MQVPGCNFDGAFLKFKQLLLKPRRQAELGQARSRLGAEVVGNVEVNVVRRYRLFSRPAGFDDGGQLCRDIQRPTVTPTRIKPLGKLFRAHMVEHIHIEFAMP